MQISEVQFSDIASKPASPMLQPVTSRNTRRSLVIFARATTDASVALRTFDRLIDLLIRWCKTYSLGNKPTSFTIAWSVTLKQFAKERHCIVFLKFETIVSRMESTSHIPQLPRSSVVRFGQDKPRFLLNRHQKRKRK